MSNVRTLATAPVVTGDIGAAVLRAVLETTNSTTLVESRKGRPASELTGDVTVQRKVWTVTHCANVVAHYSGQTRDEVLSHYGVAKSRNLATGALREEALRIRAIYAS